MEGDVGMQNLNTENVNNENFETENAQSEHLQAENTENFETENAQSKHLQAENTENFETENAQSEHLQSENVRADKGKRKISYAENQSSSEFDDSSDEDYLQPNETSTDSETPSLVLEDLEVSSDEDIFLNKNPSKRDLMHKLRRVMKKKIEKQPEVEVDKIWFSDEGENDELESLPDSENEDSLPKHDFFKESTNIKTCQLEVGMKFYDAKHFREVLRDCCIRGGFDIEYVKNEKVRVTAKCKTEWCNWRIHASPIMNDFFQIKSIQGAHTCARTYDNKLARASYLAKRMESAIRDHPNIPVQQLKNIILRKCKVDVSKQKVQRAKREALEKIRGADSVQYEKLWDYCETVRKFNPGSKLILKKLEGSNPPIFDRMYVYLWALKNEFLSGCRPIIGLDGCFLKTCYGGQMLVAVGRDGNDNMFPIAMAVVQG
ncbi:UNVERIFIED_CONTAM: hypothetical protein Slati_0137800 [Sesamum latifolium]|uniref:Transposase MuDR plant domain-containing protein n=1 Tax=Sesamum latifolium TaxID=2727402 RepID=A0AAW2YAP9_9LAMI